MTPHPGLFLFGLTGGVASGKSTVGRLLGQAGVHVIDADDLARRAVAEGQPALAEIERQFGSAVLSNGKLDRAALGKIVFADPERLAALNAIVHPRVAELLQQELLHLAKVPSSGSPLLVCYEVPLLFENGLDAWLRPVLLVACPEEQQVARAMSREGWTEEHARQRVRAQLPLAAKQTRADFVIHNDGTLDALSRATELTLDEIRKLAATLKPSLVV